MTNQNNDQNDNDQEMQIIPTAKFWIDETTKSSDQKTIEITYNKSSKRIHELLFNAVKEDDLNFAVAIQSIPQDGWASLVKMVTDLGYKRADELIGHCFFPMGGEKISLRNKMFFINLFSSNWFHFLIKGKMQLLKTMLQEIPEKFRLAFLREKIGEKIVTTVINHFGSTFLECRENTLANLIKLLPKSEQQDFWVEFKIFQAEFKLKVFLQNFPDTEHDFFIDSFREKWMADIAAEGIKSLLIILSNIPDNYQLKVLQNTLGLSVLKNMLAEYDKSYTESNQNLPMIRFEKGVIDGKSVDNWFLLPDETFSRNSPLYLVMTQLHCDDNWLLLEALGRDTVRAHFKTMAQQNEIIPLLPEAKKAEFQNLFKEEKQEQTVKFR